MKSKPTFLVKHLTSATSYVFMVLLFLEKSANSKGVPAGFSIAAFVGLGVKGAKQ